MVCALANGLASGKATGQTRRPRRARRGGFGLARWLRRVFRNDQEGRQANDTKPDCADGNAAVKREVNERGVITEPEHGTREHRVGKIAGAADRIIVETLHPVQLPGDPDSPIMSISVMMSCPDLYNI